MNIVLWNILYDINSTRFIGLEISIRKVGFMCFDLNTLFVFSN